MNTKNTNQRTDAFSRRSISFNGNSEFAPLRKKLKCRSSGNESNFVSPYGVGALRYKSIEPTIRKSYQAKNDIKVEGETSFPPILDFSELYLD